MINFIKHTPRPAAGLAEALAAYDSATVAGRLRRGASIFDLYGCAKVPERQGWQEEE